MRTRSADIITSGALTRERRGILRRNWKRTRNSLVFTFSRQTASNHPRKFSKPTKSVGGIETFYQYIKKRGDFNDLKFQDYYDEQGFAFIMLVTGQIHQAMIKAQRKLNDNTTSIFDLLLKAKALKLEKRGNYWQLKNARKRDLEVLEKVSFKPQERIQVE